MSPGLALKKRPKVIRKWPVASTKETLPNRVVGCSVCSWWSVHVSRKEVVGRFCAILKLKVTIACLFCAVLKRHNRIFLSRKYPSCRGKRISHPGSSMLPRGFGVLDLPLFLVVLWFNYRFLRSQGDSL